ncbi:MAG: prolyl oligopeptidase family serine peptidase [Gemmatimonadaceae bacterium]
MPAMTRSGALALVLAFGTVVPKAQSQDRGNGQFEFTIKNIMRGPEVYGREPTRVRFSPDGEWIYFMWLPPGTDYRESLKPYRVRAQAGARPERLTDAALDSAAPLVEAGSLSPDRTRKVVSTNGDLFLVDMRTSAVRQLTNTVVDERDPHFSADGTRVYFVRDGMNVMALDINSPLIEQLTDIRPGPPPAEAAKPDSQRARLEQQQRDLLEIVRDRVRADSIAKAEREARAGLRPKTLYLMPNERVTALSVSPNGRALLLTTSITGQGARQAAVPTYITLSGYTEELNIRTKVGDAQSSGRLAFMEVPKGTIRWLKPVPEDTTRPPSFASVLGWNDAGTQALVFAERRDFKARFLQRLDAATGALTTVDVLRDSAWVGGPCYPCGGYLPGGDDIWFVSEADGFAHLYVLGARETTPRQLTRGKFEVLDAELSEDGRYFELHTSEVSPYERHFYRLPIAGGAMERITTLAGGHQVVVSPNGARIADVYSTSNRPPELYVGALGPGAPLSQLTTSPTAEWLSFPWIVPAIVTIPASDGVRVPARIYRPADMKAKPNGAAVLFVHGAGYLHNVHNYWSSYSREYMFNQYLASKGYVVLDVDYRASAGYGRDWRTAIYRWMGGRDLGDEVDASRWLTRTYGISPDKIGLYGGSYGGFMTLMALFTSPKDFGAGAALRSVTDWAHYNHGYTARILNQPQEDTLAYHRSSPIYYAEGLEDPLLMAHGMVDVNVHYQDIVRLTERLVELGKTRWELATYPVEDHGFVRPASWTDEYRRIFELFEVNLAGRKVTGGSK